MAAGAAGGKETTPLGNRALAMSHPIRAQALRLLVERGELSPKEIADEIDGATTSDVSYHCKQLVAYDCAELVAERRVEGKGAIQHFYQATERHLLDAADWDGMDPLVKKDVLQENARLMFEDYRISVLAGVIGSDSEFHLTRTPQTLDAQGVEESMANSERWRLKQIEIEARSVARRSASGEPGIPVSSSLAFFKMPQKMKKAKGK